MKENICKQRYLKLKGLVIFLVISNMFIPLSTDLYLPALPSMAQVFGVSLSITNLTLSTFFFFYGIGMLFWGPISDKYGRRPCLIIGSSIFAIASISCSLAGNINLLIISRIFQGLGAGGITTISVAIIKDCFSGKRRESILAVIQTLGGIGPIIGPIIGGIVLKYYNWRAAFFILSFVGICCILFAILFQETLEAGQRNEGTFLNVMSRLIILIKNKAFIWTVIILSLNNLPFMGYIALSSYIYQDYYLLSEQVFSYYFAANACAYMIGPILYIKFFSGFNKRKLIKYIFITSSICGIFIICIGYRNPWYFWLGFLAYSLINSSMRPLSINLMLDQHQGDSGTAASLINSTSTVLGCIGMLIASISWINVVIGLGVIITVISFLSLFGWIVFMRSSILCKGVSIEKEIA